MIKHALRGFGAAVVLVAGISLLQWLLAGWLPERRTMFRGLGPPWGEVALFAGVSLMTILGSILEAACDPYLDAAWARLRSHGWAGYVIAIPGFVVLVAVMFAVLAGASFLPVDFAVRQWLRAGPLDQATIIEGAALCAPWATLALVGLQLAEPPRPALLWPTVGLGLFWLVVAVVVRDPVAAAFALLVVPVLWRARGVGAAAVSVSTTPAGPIGIAWRNKGFLFACIIAAWLGLEVGGQGTGILQALLAVARR
jgi:hypothetical protein